MKKRESQYNQKKMFNKDIQKKFTESWHEEYTGQRTPLCGNSRVPYWKSLWGEKAQYNGKSIMDRKKIEKENQ
jgi:hypothetical protein